MQKTSEIVRALSPQKDKTVSIKDYSIIVQVEGEEQTFSVVGYQKKYRTKQDAEVDREKLCDDVRDGKIAISLNGENLEIIAYGIVENDRLE